MKTKHKKAWGGRFAKASDPLLEQFNASLPFDKRLYVEDIDGSIAHARMLQKIGVLTVVELKRLEKGLNQIKKEIGTGKFTWSIADEDIHMAVEARLTAIIGTTAGKLHTARSRNDQVALDIRLFCKRRVLALIHALSGLQEALLTLAEEQGFVPMPGYTHMQRAQPILFAHHLLAYFEMLERDKSRLQGTLERLDYSPLGSGALAGTTFPIDREFVAKELGFKGVTRNSLDSVSDRDFVVEILANNSLIMTHFSRFAEELVLWCSQEFQFVTLPQNFCTGSSMMPQKVNPDVPELIRGKTGRVYGNLVNLLTVIKGLPLAYNKDLQEDKEPLFDSLDTIFMVVQVLTAMVPGIEVRADKMRQATDEGFLLATDLADYLASKKVPFRQCHEIVGQIIQYCIQKKTTLEKLSLAEMKKFSSVIDKDVSQWLDLEASINKRKSTGGTAEKQVRAALKDAWKKI